MKTVRKMIELSPSVDSYDVTKFRQNVSKIILGDPGADKGGEGKSKRAEKYIWNEEK